MAHRVMRLRDGQIIKNKINETRNESRRFRVVGD